MMTSRSTERMEAKFKEGMCVKKKKDVEIQLVY